MNAVLQRTAGFIVLLLLAAGSGIGAGLCAEVPAFVREPIHSPNAARVAKVVPSFAADLVVLDGGREQGMRRGAVCTMQRGPSSIGEIILIETRAKRSAGLILELDRGATIRKGDIARIKAIPTS